MREWIKVQEAQGNKYAAEAGKRLLKEFGDVQVHNPGNTLWLAIDTLRRLQALPHRSTAAEDVTLASILGDDDPFRGAESRTVRETTYTMTAGKWAQLITPDQMTTDDTIDTRDIKFKEFILDDLDGDAGSPIQENVWMMVVEEIDTNNEWRVPVADISGVYAHVRPVSGEAVV